MMSAGQWVQQVTLGWLLYDLTGNSMLLGALNGLRALPFLVTGPWPASPPIAWTGANCYCALNGS